MLLGFFFVFIDEKTEMRIDYLALLVFSIQDN